MTIPRSSLLPALALAAALLAGCGDDDDPSDAAADSTSTEIVTMEESRYMPRTLEVATGTEVTFENTDPYAHTVTAAEGSAATFDSGDLAQDETFSRSFDEPGTYEYFCQIHPTMQAEVIVS